MTPSVRPCINPTFLFTAELFFSVFHQLPWRALLWSWNHNGIIHIMFVLPMKVMIFISISICCKQLTQQFCMDHVLTYLEIMNTETSYWYMIIVLPLLFIYFAHDKINILYEATHFSGSWRSKKVNVRLHNMYEVYMHILFTSTSHFILKIFFLLIKCVSNVVF